MKLRDRFESLRTWWRVKTEPRWCRERHAETLEALRETASEANALRSRLASRNRDESREALLKTCKAIEAFARAVAEHGMPRVKAITLPARSRYDLMNVRELPVSSVSGVAFLEPDGLHLLGIRIHFRPDVAPSAFMVEMETD